MVLFFFCEVSLFDFRIVYLFIIFFGFIRLLGIDRISFFVCTDIVKQLFAD